MDLILDKIRIGSTAKLFSNKGSIYSILSSNTVTLAKFLFKNK